MATKLGFCQKCNSLWKAQLLRMDEYEQYWFLIKTKNVSTMIHLAIKNTFCFGGILQKLAWKGGFNCVYLTQLPEHKYRLQRKFLNVFA